MYQVKKEFLGQGSKVCVNRPDLAIQNINTVIALDCCTQDEMKLLFDMNTGHIEKVSEKSVK